LNVDLINTTGWDCKIDTECVWECLREWGRSMEGMKVKGIWLMGFIHIYETDIFLELL
jgi:hypothetical protein